MRYFLKKSYPSKKGLYLQIYQSSYIPKIGNRNKSFKSLGYVCDLIEQGIQDPVSYYQAYVNQLNSELIQSECLQIGDVSLTKNLGYFLLKGMIDFLDVDNYVNLVSVTKKFRFNVSDFIRSMIYAQVCNPGSKLSSFENVIPNIYGIKSFSYDQILDCINFLGEDYQKFIEVFNHQIENKFGRNTQTSYFDCTNYYFEIDIPYDDKQKGPSKENRTDPIISQALLLDENQIPIAMEMFPGNKSEKPYIRKIIQDIKERYSITSKIVQVADKGLNCAKNIYSACKESNDGYIFSKSFRGKALSEVEKKWITLEDNEANKWECFYDKNGNLEYKLKETVDDFTYHCKVNADDLTETFFTVREKWIASYNEQLAKKQKCEIYKEVEKLSNRLTAKNLAKEELGDSAKYVTIKYKDDKKSIVKVELNQEKIAEDLKYAGYNLIVTSEIDKTSKEIYNAYHSLWRIEESFRTMKTYLEARPVYLQKEESIYGHFLICYLSLTILRLIEFKLLKDEIPIGEIVKFIRKYIITETLEGTYINGATLSSTHKRIKEVLNIRCLGNAFLKQKDVDQLLNLHLEDMF